MNEASVDENIRINVVYGWIGMYRIHKVDTDGSLLCGHRIIDYDRQGNVRSEKEVFGCRVFYD